MIYSAIKDLERAMRVLDDLPNTIEKDTTKTLSALNDIFEDVYDQFSSDEGGVKKIVALKRDVMSCVQDFADRSCIEVKEHIRIVEE